MGLHHNLTIYQTAYELLSLATDITRNIPRDLKAGLGAHIRNECVSILLLIARANSAKQKEPHLVELLERKETIEFLMRVLKDKKFIGIKQHAAAMRVTVSLGKQANGWKRYSTPSPAV